MRRALALTVFFAAFGLSGPVSADGDPERGRVLANTCLGCHGVESYNNVYPTYKVPKLAGQHADYIVAALKAYQNKERSHSTMHSQAASMSEQNMLDIAAYIAAVPAGKAD